MLPALEKLQFEHGCKMQLDAGLLSLRYLKIASVEEVQLAGPGLSLPRLTSLWLSNASRTAVPRQFRAEIKFMALPSLAFLAVHGMSEVSTAGGGLLDVPLLNLTGPRPLRTALALCIPGAASGAPQPAGAGCQRPCGE